MWLKSVVGPPWRPRNWHTHALGAPSGGTFQVQLASSGGNRSETAGDVDGFVCVLDHFGPFWTIFFLILDVMCLHVLRFLHLFACLLCFVW